MAKIPQYSRSKCKKRCIDCGGTMHRAWKGRCYRCYLKYINKKEIEELKNENKKYISVYYFVWRFIYVSSSFINK